jgi:two-component system, NtrC family, response regulator HydG
MTKAPEKQGSILIADDNEDFTLGLKMLISPYFEEVEVESNPDKILYHIETRHFDLVLLDMNFRAGMHSGNEGFFIMNKIREKDKDIRLVFITGYGDVELAVESMKKGASDFIEKSWDERKILSTILANYRLGRTMNEVQRRKNQGRVLSEVYGLEHPVCTGVSARMARVMQVIMKVAPTDASILITGESGTGKEVMARQIHMLSQRAGEIFLSVDLGAIPASLFESELFGYARGSFTDAVHDKAGKIESASGGTLFLDEIGNLPPELQTKLLGVLQQRVVTRLGETKGRSVDFRLITATNAFIPERIRQKLFREDLFYRIRTVEIELPPLRERPEDIPELAGCFMDLFSKKYKKEDVSIDKKAVKKLQEYHWPGNVRELQHQVEKAIIMADGDLISASDFDLGSGNESRMRAETLNLEQHERLLIIKAIKKSEGNLSRAASELGINRSTLYEKIKKYEIRPF